MFIIILLSYLPHMNAKRKLGCSCKKKIIGQLTCEGDSIGSVHNHQELIEDENLDVYLLSF
jgi:hypothetical protein